MSKRGVYNVYGIALTLLVVELLFWLLAGGLYLGLKTYAPGLVYHRPAYFWLLLSLPLISIIFLLMLRWKNKRIKAFSEVGLVSEILPDLSSTRTIFKFLLYRFALASFIIGLIGPKVGSKLEEVKSLGIDVIVALDVSRSMMAEDIAPNRLERAKQTIGQLIDRLKGDRIGIIVFAGEAYVQLPITSDYEAARMFLESIDTESVPVQGTAIGSAIDLAMESFGDAESRSRSVIIITDGENHEDDAIGSASAAAEAGVNLHVIGMGSVDGAPVPVIDSNGNKVGFKKDAAGQTVVSALNESMLVQLVDAGKGVFIRAGGSYVGINELIAELGKMQKQEQGVYQFSDYEHRFQWFFAFGVFLLLVDVLTGSARKSWTEALNLFDA
jgi:Ca-activated chloride channel family protein